PPEPRRPAVALNRLASSLFPHGDPGQSMPGIEGSAIGVPGAGLQARFRDSWRSVAGPARRVGLELAMERRHPDSEKVRGLGPVSVAGLQDAQDVVLFDLRESTDLSS